MGFFDKFKKGKVVEKENRGEDKSRAISLLEKHKRGEIDDESFLREFASVSVFYTTPVGDATDGTVKLFLIPGPERTGYLPVFVDLDSMKAHYEKAGRVAYLIIEGTFISALETTKKANDGGAPVKMGLLIDPANYGVTVDAQVLDVVIAMAGR